MLLSNEEASAYQFPAQPWQVCKERGRCVLVATILHEHQSGHCRKALLVKARFPIVEEYLDYFQSNSFAAAFEAA